MNLHRTLGVPDWHDTPVAQRSILQRLAAGTKGFVTLGNLISLIGIGLVFLGCVLIVAEQYWLGGTLIVIGRLLDLADGYVADKTKTKGPVGEVVDASFDKFGTIAALITLFVADIVAWPLLIALLVPQLIISLISFYRKAHRQTIHPSLVGKLSMAAVWTAIAAFLLAKASEIWVLSFAGVLIALLSFALGTIACVQYALQKAK
jgi:cardiolipin synthase